MPRTSRGLPRLVDAMREKIRCGRDSGIGGRPPSYTRGLLRATYPGFFARLRAQACDAEHTWPNNRVGTGIDPAGARPAGPEVGRRRGPSWLLAAALACAACRFTADDRRAIEGVLADQVAAWNRGDIETFLRAYEPSEDLIFTSGGAIRRGFAAARARYLERYGARGAETMGRLDFEILDIRALGPRGAVVLGRWRLTATEVAGAGVFSLAFSRERGRWYIVHDHTSLDTPETPEKQPDTDASPEL